MLCIVLNRVSLRLACRTLPGLRSGSAAVITRARLSLSLQCLRFRRAPSSCRFIIMENYLLLSPWGAFLCARHIWGENSHIFMSRLYVKYSELWCYMVGLFKNVWLFDLFKNIVYHYKIMLLACRRNAWWRHDAISLKQ